jgi:hypothetical protein
MRAISAVRLLSSTADRSSRSLALDFAANLPLARLTGDQSILGYGEMWSIGSALRAIMIPICACERDSRGSLKRSCSNVIRARRHQSLQKGRAREDKRHARRPTMSSIPPI